MCEKIENINSTRKSWARP